MLIVPLLCALFAPGPQIRHIPVAPAETMAVSIAGSGPPIVIIPGMLGGAYGFRTVAEQLAEAGQSVVIVDPLGTGASSRPREADFSSTAQALRVAAVLDSLGIRNALVAAHAVSGTIAFRLALLRPDLVGGILSINGSATQVHGSNSLRFALRLVPILKIIGGKGIVTRKLTNGLRDSSHDPAWVTKEVVARYTAPYALDFGASLGVLKKIANATEPWPLMQRLGELRIPIVFLWGTGGKSSMLDAKEIAPMTAALSDFSIETLPAIGMYVQEEAPSIVTAAVSALRKRMDAHLEAALQ